MNSNLHLCFAGNPLTCPATSTTCPSTPLHQGTKGFPGHGWTASSGVRHGIPDESLGKESTSPMKWTTKWPHTPSPRDQNTGGFTVPGGSRGFYENPPNVWWLKHRNQACVKCKWVEHLPQIDTPDPKIGILGRPLEQGKNIYQSTNFGFNIC